MNSVVSVASLVSASAVAAPSIAPNPGVRTAAEQLNRVEHMIDLLRTRHVADGFKLDDASAERVLRYFRTAVEDPNHEDRPEYESDWMFVNEFISDHGQSYDWLLAGDVDGMICKSAARSRAASRMKVDPIVAAIEEHRLAFTEHMGVITNVPNVDDDLISSGAEYEASYERQENAAIALTSIQPTTIEGVLALFAHIHQFNQGRMVCARRPSCYADHDWWPDVLVDEEVKNGRGAVLELPFAFWIMENVRAALSEITGAQSEPVS